MSMNKTWAISSWISFLTSADIRIHMETPVTEIVSVRLPRVERKPRPREIAAHRLQSAIENVKTCTERAKRVEWIENIVVPVVQRIKRRFMKDNIALLTNSTNDI